MASSLSFSSSFLSIAIVLLLLCNHSSARDFLVGGSSNAWKVPSSSLESLNKWAEANRFQISDSLVWKMDSEKDSVVQVTRENYFSCNITNPIFQSKEGASSVAVKLSRPGAYYFISGQKTNCGKGQRVIVVVMSRRSSLMGMMAPASSPSDNAESPDIAPTAGAAAASAGKGGSVAGRVLVVLAIISVFV